LRKRIGRQSKFLKNHLPLLVSANGSWQSWSTLKRIIIHQRAPRESKKLHLKKFWQVHKRFSRRLPKSRALLPKSRCSLSKPSRSLISLKRRRLCLWPPPVKPQWSAKCSLTLAMRTGTTLFLMSTHSQKTKSAFGTTLRKTQQITMAPTWS